MRTLPLLLMALACDASDPLQPEPPSSCEPDCADFMDLAVAGDGPVKPAQHDLAHAQPQPPAPDLATAIAMDLGDPLQPPGHPDDPELLNPARMRITNCTQLTPLPPAQVADFFPDGLGSWSAGATARTADFALVSLATNTRHCNPTTGCEPWGAYYDSRQHYLFLFIADAGQLQLAQYDDTGTLITQRQVDSSSFTASFQAYPNMRRFEVDITDKGFCLETLVTSNPTATGTIEYAFTAIMSQDHTTLAARPSPEPVPSPSPSCNAAPATPAELAAWFPPGYTLQYLQGESRASVFRACHPVTGCSRFKPETVPFFDHLSVMGSDIVFYGTDPSQTNGGMYTLINSQYSSSAVSIVFGATCARASGHNLAPGGRYNQLERVTSASVNK